MPTDDELTTMLRRSFAQATADLDLKSDLVHVVRRCYARVRRRRLVVGVAVPAAALAAGSGFALAARNTPGHNDMAVPPPSVTAPSVSTPRPTPVTSVPVKPASYKVVLNNHGTPPNCPVNATAPVGKSENPAGAWFWTKGQCVFVGVTGRTPSLRPLRRSKSRATRAFTARSKAGRTPFTPRSRRARSTPTRGAAGWC